MSAEIIFTQHLVNGLLLSGIYGLVAVGLTLIYGVLEIVNFAHGEFYMLGAYFTFIASAWLGLPYYVSVILAVLSSAFIALIVERGAIRPIVERSFESKVLSTFAISMILANAVLLLFTATPRTVRTGIAGTIEFAGVFFSVERVVALLTGYLAFLALHLFLQRTRLGKAIRAVAQNRDACYVVGIDLHKMARLTFALGIGLAGLAGALIAPIFSIEPSMGQAVVLKAFAIVIVGGFGSVKGAALAALIVGLGESLVGGYVSATLKDGLAFLIIILVLIIRPQGIFGRATRVL
ncbi:MAG: branched-chain amino acid ABC transporter permease [Nitrososphaerales archaeon]